MSEEVKDLGYYLAHEDEYNALTEDQVIALSHGETVEGETAEPTAEPEEAPALEPEVVEPVVEEVLLAKDGKHIIPFERLQEMTDKAAQWEAFAREQAALVESLKQAKIEDAKTGGTEAQEAVMDEYKGEFPEVFDDLKGHIQTMIEAGVSAKMTAMEARLKAEIAPMQKVAVDNAMDAHFNAIKSAISDFDKLVESGAVQDWIKTQPSYVQKAATEVLEQGTAGEVIELFSSYKASLPNAAAPSKQDLQSKANAVIAKAKVRTPTSLTDVPSGTQSAIDEEEANPSGTSLLNKYQGWDEQRILKDMARAR